ncbi:MAG: SAM-dependent DNA methyltransferase [Promethearchaeota archaeon]|nr:MAG: SAM-dependent DNA methyltransferase [Candidatus Lokiarchaeota archaeon]
MKREGKSIKELEDKAVRRKFGLHLTSVDIFHKFIFPEIKDLINDYIWIDLYAGEGNLILPLLEYIPKAERIEFFKNHIYLFDVRSDMIQSCIKNAESYGIPSNIALENIKYRNNLESFPVFLKNNQFPIYHITNPPYLYLGYIRKHKQTQRYLNYFKDKNEGYQDLYQIAMINDLRNEIKKLTYIIPTNFLYGASVSNKFRLDFLKYYKIIKMVIFETKIFEYTGTNICIGVFERKSLTRNEIQEFEGLKIKDENQQLKRSYILNPEFKYRAGSEFLEFLKEYKSEKPLIVNYYFLHDEVVKNKGKNRIQVIDSNHYINNQYKKMDLYVNDSLKNKIESNILYVQTVDKGSSEGRVGLKVIRKDFDVNGIYVSSNTYRTHPIQIFLKPALILEDQLLLKEYFNFVLEHFREELDSEFLTTYKYSNAEYTRKYLGLTQVRSLIETFPITKFDDLNKKKIREAIDQKDFEKLLNVLKKKDDNLFIF